MDIRPEELYQLEDKVLVDIRSPSEYAEFHIPGALNVPLFEDQEKRLIGLIYRGEGLEKAKSLGYQIAWGKFQKLLQTFEELRKKHRHVIVYCWRGGLRSQELCRALNSMGIEVLRLEGGYRAYREFILRDMERELQQKEFLVLTGKTGVGKTRLIRRLKEEGFPALDLEELAKDRGSVFGKVGIQERVSQKLFDALLYEELRKEEAPLLLIEDESRVMGNLHIPEALWWKKEEGIFIEIQASTEVRLKNLIEEYTGFPNWQEQVKKSLYKIRKYLGEQKSEMALNLLSAGKVEELALFLMREYYDKTYRSRREPSFHLDCTHFEECLQRLKELYACLLKERQTPQLCR